MFICLLTDVQLKTFSELECHKQSKQSFCFKNTKWPICFPPSPFIDLWRYYTPKTTPLSVAFQKLFLPLSLAVDTTSQVFIDMLSHASRWYVILLKGCDTSLLGFQDKLGLFPVPHSHISSDCDNVLLGY